jgi:hypothetical protein
MRETIFGTNSFEYRLINYVPSILSDKKVSIAAVIFDSSNRDGQRCILWVAPDWRQRVRDLDQDSDLEMLDSFLKEVLTRLHCDPIEVMAQFEESLSNAIQISELRKPQVNLMSSNIEACAAAILRQENAVALTSVDSNNPLVTNPAPDKERVGA